MRKITTIAIHCSATRPSMDIGATEIRQWHKARGWTDIGYHYVIRRNGLIELGRQVSIPGAHVRGHNMDSIGVCLVGGVNRQGKPDANFSASQYAQLNQLVAYLRRQHPAISFDKKHIRGHRDFDGVAKACPCFDVAAFFQLKD